MARACCKSCNWENTTRSLARLQKHLESCKGPATNTFTIDDEPDDSTSSSSRLLSSTPAPSQASSSTPVSETTPLNSLKRKRQSTIAGQFDCLTPDEAQRIDAELARCVYEEGFPLSIVDKPAFKRFLRAVRPAYNPPARRQLSEQLLEEAYQRKKQEVDAALTKAPMISIVSDGWTNVRNESIINYLASVNGEVFFYKSSCSGSNRHTAEFIANGLKDVITSLGPDKVISVTTDNAANMVSAWKLLRQDNHRLITLGCCSHRLNLLGNDIVKHKDYQPIWQTAVMIAKWFKARSLATAVVKEEMERINTYKAFMVPGNTRWQGKVHTIRSVIHNLEGIQKAFVSRKLLDVYGRQDEFQALQLKVFSNALKDDLHLLQEILEPLLRVIIALETDKPALSSVYRHMQFLYQRACQQPIEGKLELQQLYLQRLKQAWHPLMVIAYLADVPLRRSKKALTITNEQIADSTRWLSENYMTTEEAAPMLGLLMHLRDYKKPFDNELLLAGATTMTAIEWWQFQEGRIDQKLVELCQVVLSVPPTSGAAERNWSEYGSIHSCKRNKLSNDRAEKLVYLRHNLRLQTRKNTEHSQDIDGYLQEFDDNHLEEDNDGETDTEAFFEALDHLQQSSCESSTIALLPTPPISQLPQGLQEAFQPHLEYSQSWQATPSQYSQGG